MAQFLNMFSFLAVLLRAGTLATQSLVVGGVLFALIEPKVEWARTRRWIIGGALALCLIQAAYVASDTALLVGTADLSVAEIAGANFFIAGSIATAAALLTAIFASRLPAPRRWLLAPALLLIAASVATSHAAARVDLRVPALAFTALHQAATAAWIGGLPFLLIALRRIDQAERARAVIRPFSRVAMWSVAALLVGGIGLSFLYVDNAQGLYGTAYGIMVIGKIILFLLIAVLGFVNWRMWSGPDARARSFLSGLRLFSEAEIGIGFTVVLAAASLTSQPPAVDMQANRVTPAEIAARVRPLPPRLNSPPLTDLTPPTLPSSDPNRLASYVPGTVSKPSSPGDIAWSEYNHNWSGVVVLTIGVLAVASRVFGLRWARNWPLAFIGLAIFILLRADPEAWPLGPKGFWSSMADPEVLQHRIFSVMIVAFAVFEWRVQMGRMRNQWAALVFPAVCALGGALLMTHSHALGNVKEEYLAELSHLPIALFAVTAGWSRWLEQRLDAAWKRVPATIWPACFVMIGLMLLFYREA